MINTRGTKVRRFILLSFIPIFALAACGEEGQNSEASTASATPNPAPRSADAPPLSTEQEVSVRLFDQETGNEREERGSAKLSVIEVDLDAPPPSDPYWKPKMKKGYKLARARIRIENTGSESLDQHGFRYSLVTDKGRRYPILKERVYSGQGDCCGIGWGDRPPTLEPGDVSRGWFPFQIDPRYLPTKVRADSDIGDFDRVEWSIGQ